MLPPYCTALYGKYHGQPQPQNHPLKHTIPDCPAVHHYCDGLKFQLRGNMNAARGANGDAEYNFGRAIKTFNGMINDWKQRKPNCPLLPQAYANLGKTILRASDFASVNITDALPAYEHAIRLAPTYVPAYVGLADFYLKIGNKQEALTAIERGLKKKPSSKWLARRHQDLLGELKSTGNDAKTK